MLDRTMTPIIAFLLLATLETQMNPEELAKTGLSKLSSKEKVALQTWIDQHYLKRHLKKKVQPLLQESLNNGKRIGLTDHSSWEIHPNDTPITQSWITPVEIWVENVEEGEYPYRLKNSLTGSEVRAKIVLSCEDP